ncbi:recombinase family protein [Bradyrhizobium genosp. P]|uniref:recombinase family protein n=1 Tax=Bradyrhizobium genosp. P TaxID=83641 RepID=UPI003CEA0DEF
MSRKAKQVKAVSYLRTSSAAGVGADKDSDKRQRASIAGYAKQAGFDVVDEYYDPAVSGVDPIETRPGFAALLDRIESNGVRTVIVEDASRFARDLITQELGILALINRGVRVLTAGGDDLTDSGDPTRVMMRQIAGAFHQYEKSRLVNRLKVARDRKREENGKCGGRKTYAERDSDRDRAMLAKARELSEQRPRLSLRQISAALQEAGYITPKGNPYAASAVASMVRNR